MIAKLEEYLDIFYEQDFHDIAISAKSMDAPIVIDAYTEISRRFDHPLHLGVTHAGPKETGCIRSVAALGTLLANGIGDTIRISYANDPVYEVEDGLELLYALGLRERKGAELIACPTCGRIQVDLFTLVQDVRRSSSYEIELPMKVAVMGCVVNGPGEAEGADVAVFAGDRKGIIYVQGQRVATVPEDEILDRLLDECKIFRSASARARRQLGEKKVDIVPAVPLLPRIRVPVPVRFVRYEVELGAWGGIGEETVSDRLTGSAPVGGVRRLPSALCPRLRTTGRARA